MPYGSNGSAASAPLTSALLLAYAIVYVVWGSTYLAIRFAIETLPPLMMTGARFLVAGSLLLGVLLLRGHSLPSRAEWWGGALTGTLMLGAGVGGVSWAEQRIPSGIAALLVTMVPIWMVLLEWLRTRERPSVVAFIGLAMGFMGVSLLISPQDVVGGEPTDLVGAIVVLSGSLFWSFGSVYGAAMPRPENPFMAAATQMLTAGGLLAAVGFGAGERVVLGGVSTPSVAAWGYLVVFGSVIAFTAYTWLLRVDRASRVGTYAYVNPVVAVLLGWLLASEPLTPRVIVAAVAVVGAVMLIRRARYQQAARPARDLAQDEQHTLPNREAATHRT
jgi:drug/metabolite transporter (DMT)-like permease